MPTVAAAGRRAGTIASRVAARTNPAIALPDPPARVDRRATLKRLTLSIDGVKYLIGPAVEGDPATAGTVDSGATVTVTVRDPAGKVTRLLADEQVLLNGDVTATISDTVYVVQSANGDETGLLTIILEDQVAWRMKQFSTFKKVRRGSNGVFGYADVLVKEASAPPLAQMDFYCPELHDQQQIARAKKTTDPAKGRGTGQTSTYTVKGVAADSEQRRVIDSALSEADRLGASEQVMVAVVMCMTNESTCRIIMHGDAARNDTIGAFQQGPEWVSRANVVDPALACRAFLIGHEAHVGGTGRVLGWKQHFGSLKTSHGDLGAEIVTVQIGGAGASRWEGEARRTVKTWSGSSSGHQKTVTDPFEFTRGDRNGETENSWDSLGRYVTDLNVRRWAQNNTLNVVSDQELNAAAPSLEIDGTENFLISRPAWGWSPGREINETTLQVRAELWSIQLGAVVRLTRDWGPYQGSWLVAEEAGYMVNPDMSVTLRRAAPQRKEPAATTREVSTGGTLIGTSSMKQVCQGISGEDRAYPSPDVHHGSFKNFTKSTPLDCSESVCFALWRAGLFKGSQAFVSGEFGAHFPAGKGKEFTMCWSASHVWILFPDGSRFDTSPWGDGPSGPHYRTKPRPTTGFNFCHVKGH